ncbi:DMT family transporter [Phenylobacterium sp.]|uniref:DMT family transporter n=1 Tax=Phenylobacterium sp. TaxID=1871053 RepID=UPI002E32AD31|nr:DMT family transporter [Phenylobacterium sp.]HEX2561949.1 DMT family transporter [Phenylobacterium sp.]
MTVPSTGSDRPDVQRIGLGIALRVGAMACMAAMFAGVKWTAGQGIPVLEIVFFRNAFAFIPIALYILPTTGLRVLKTRRPLGHLARSAVGLTGMVCGFSAASLLPLTEATAISFAAPLFMTALSALILKEKVGRHRWGAVAVGFVGVLIMVRPSPTEFANLGVLFGLAGALGAAGAMIAIREIGRTEPGPTIVFYFTLAGMLVGLASLPFGWVTPEPFTLGILVVMGLLGGVGQLLLTQALKVAPVAAVAPFDYTQLIWASGFGFLIWGELPRPVTVVGALVVAASGVYILYRETLRMRQVRRDAT